MQNVVRKGKKMGKRKKLNYKKKVEKGSGKVEGGV